jgi:hypothetical protein
LAYETGPQQGTSKADKIAADEARNAFELKSQLYTNPAQYSYAIRDWVMSNRGDTKSQPPGFVNQLDYIQALLRESGLSADNTPRGTLGNKDVDAIQSVSRIALQNGTDFLTQLKDLYANKNKTTPSFSKNISTAIRLIDKGDAKSALSNSYYQAFGAFPAQNQINDFMNLYNVEAKKQKSMSTTTSTTAGGVTRSNTVTGDEGFTEKEQQQFLANYLSKNFGVATSANLGGTAKTIYDSIVATHKNNFLAEPDFKEVSGLIANIIGAGDDKVSNQMLDDYKNQQRRVASKQYLGIQAELLAGEDAATYTKPILDFLIKTSGRNVSADDKFIKNALNFKDDKGNYRMMNEFEMKQAWLNDPRSATSPDSINQATTVGNLVRQKLNR